LRRGLKFAATAAGVLLLAHAAAEAQEVKGQPYELVRALQSLQDKAVRGNAQAHAEQRVLLAQIAEQFEGLSAEGWRDPRNARAAVIFVLSGGNARVLGKVAQSEGAKGMNVKVLLGTLAFGEGRLDKAYEMLSAVQARALDTSMAGHVAYVQGELTSKKEPAEALAYFDEARLLSPGTIVEEAALRRQIALLAAASEPDRYDRLAVQYLRRFPRSVYANGFRQQFAGGLARAKSVDVARLARLEGLLDGLDAAERRDIYLMLAEEAIGHGKVDTARFAAARAVHLTDEGSAERERARLYEAAALVATDELERGIETLRTLDQSKLTVGDAVLREAALAVAADVRRLPETTAAAQAQGPERSPAVERALRSIAQVDELLGKAGRP
jgi:chemotaxis protein MotC